MARQEGFKTTHTQGRRVMKREHIECQSCHYLMSPKDARCRRCGGNPGPMLERAKTATTFAKKHCLLQKYKLSMVLLNRAVREGKVRVQTIEGANGPYFRYCREDVEALPESQLTILQKLEEKRKHAQMVLKAKERAAKRADMTHGHGIKCRQKTCACRDTDVIETKLGLNCVIRKRRCKVCRVVFMTREERVHWRPSRQPRTSAAKETDKNE